MTDVQSKTKRSCSRLSVRGFHSFVQDARHVMRLLFTVKALYCFARGRNPSQCSSLLNKFLVISKNFCSCSCSLFQSTSPTHNTFISEGY
jgi:hypothetical protein